MEWHIDWGRQRKLKISPNMHARITMESNKRFFFVVGVAIVIVVVVVFAGVVVGVQLSAASVSYNSYDAHNEDSMWSH